MLTEEDIKQLNAISKIHDILEKEFEEILDRVDILLSGAMYLFSIKGWSQEEYMEYCKDRVDEITEKDWDENKNEI